ncbi:MAG TPA: enoyl-CoA hydratase-related protein [Roseiflexaceae bacterium]|nr:enoyl-CoA hydratase-related protein [Roseiflexaceae bacterium]
MTIRIDRAGPIATLLLDRPQVRNALDAAMIDTLNAAFAELAADSAVRVVVLTGAGTAFCAGGDLNWMRASLQLHAEANLAEIERLSLLFEQAWAFPKPLIGRVNGVAIGAGAGLIACCDLAVAANHARFGFGEVKVGLVPAIFSRYVIPKIGVGHARALFVSGEQFSAERAFEIGLVHAVVDVPDLDATVAAIAARCRSSAPEAVALTKQVIDTVWEAERDEARRATIKTIAAVRRSAEAQEGISAFLEKRRPRWNLQS